MQDHPVSRPTAVPWRTFHVLVAAAACAVHPSTIDSAAAPAWQLAQQTVGRGVSAPGEDGDRAADSARQLPGDGSISHLVSIGSLFAHSWK